MGLLIGDAMGVPYEFRSRGELPCPDSIEMAPPPDFRRAHAVPPGTWSDEGAQALCLLTSLRDRGRFDLEDFVGRLQSWLNQGYMAVDGRVFDIEPQTLGALRAMRLGVPPLEAASPNAESISSGSLARTLPLALLCEGPDQELVAAAHLQSRITHPHMRAQVSCALYALWARYELERRGNAWGAAYRRLWQLYSGVAAFRNVPELAAELTSCFRLDADARAHGSADAVDCLLAARSACVEHRFERVMKQAIALGGATGAIASVAGGIAGIRQGTAGIPERWLKTLRGRQIVEPLLESMPRSARETAAGQRR